MLDIPRLTVKYRVKLGIITPVSSLGMCSMHTCWLFQDWQWNIEWNLELLRQSLPLACVVCTHVGYSKIESEMLSETWNCYSLFSWHVWYVHILGIPGLMVAKTCVQSISSAPTKSISWLPCHSGAKKNPSHPGTHFRFWAREMWNTFKGGWGNTFPVIRDWTKIISVTGISRLLFLWSVIEKYAWSVTFYSCDLWWSQYYFCDLWLTYFISVTITETSIFFRDPVIRPPYPPHFRQSFLH